MDDKCGRRQSKSNEDAQGETGRLVYQITLPPSKTVGTVASPGSVTGEIVLCILLDMFKIWVSRFRKPFLEPVRTIAVLPIFLINSELELNLEYQTNRMSQRMTGCIVFWNSTDSRQIWNINGLVSPTVTAAKVLGGADSGLNCP